MDKLDKQIMDFLSPQFDKYSNCDKITFNLYNIDDVYHPCEESISINDIYWDSLPDDRLSKVEEHIREAMGKLPNIPEITNIKEELGKLADSFRDKACADPINEIWRDFWQPVNLKPFGESITKECKKRFPPRYVDYVSVEVFRDGKINYYPDGEDE